jgi:hypothetical protein
MENEVFSGYRGQHRLFDPAAVKTYPLAGRPNKVQLSDLVQPDRVPSSRPAAASDIEILAAIVRETRQAGRPVIVFTGAHLVKNGFSPLVIELMNRGLVTLVAGNGAVSIHDFELALIGQTSESVPNALPEGKFGLADDFPLYNKMVNEGYDRGLGLGEALGKAINSDQAFKHPEVSILAAGSKLGLPVTIHLGIGTDVNQQHPSFSGARAGGASHRDFLIFSEQIGQMAKGGVFINIGSAVTGPEVMLKTISMVASAGRAPRSIVTADFDLRPADPKAMADEKSPFYYFRDQKSIVTRVPQSFGGRGFYIEGDQRQTFPYFFSCLIRK